MGPLRETGRAQPEALCSCSGQCSALWPQRPRFDSESQQWLCRDPEQRPRPTSPILLSEMFLCVPTTGCLGGHGHLSEVLEGLEPPCFLGEEALRGALRGSHEGRL